VKQNINPWLAVAVAVGVLIIVAIGVVRTLRGPVAASGPVGKPIPRAQMDKMMREGHEQYMQFKRGQQNASVPNNASAPPR
jgi:hypothetical protein